MSINSYLDNCASNLILSTNEKNSITTSISTLETRLNLYFGSEIEEKFVFGSYTRVTILPRKIDENSDIDYMVVFDNSYNYKPQTFLDKLRKFAQLKYSTSEIHQSYPTIVLELNHIKFELVPAYKSYGTYYIPNGDNWISTYPNEFNNELTRCNNCNSYKIKPLVRLIKYWNVNCNNHKLTSYMIEKKIASELMYASYWCFNYIDYLKRAFEEVKKITYDTEIKNRIDKAISIINKAIEYENNIMPYSALEEIKKIFPEV